MMHGSWFLPQQQFVILRSGKNRGEAKVVKKAQGAPFLLAKRSRRTGSRGAPGRTTLQPDWAQGLVRLYRPDNSTIKCPARHVGPGILAGGKLQPHKWAA